MNPRTLEPKTRSKKSLLGASMRHAMPQRAKDRIPATSPAAYLSGTTALNIPAPEGTGGDWHLLTLLSDSKTRFFIAGDAPDAFVNTNRVLGNLGIHECSATLRQWGAKIPAQVRVYAANHVRAILDLLLFTTKEKTSLDFIRASDYFDNDSQMQLLRDAIKLVSKKLSASQRQHIQNWLAHQAA